MLFFILTTILCGTCSGDVTTTGEETPTPCIDLTTFSAPPTINDFPYNTIPDQEHTFDSPVREPSGVVYIPTYDSLFMVDDGGVVARLSRAEVVLDDWSVGGDLEGITYNPATNKIYIVVESPQALREYSYNAGAGTFTKDQEWSLSSLISCAAANSCLEAVTFVPTSASSQGGLFYIGNQEDGFIRIVEIWLGTGTSFTPRLFSAAPGGSAVAPPTGISADISGLYYESSSGLVWAIFDTYNRMSVLDPATNSYIYQFNLPSVAAGTTQNEEGITFDGQCSIHIAEDTIDGNVYGRIRRFD